MRALCPIAAALHAWTSRHRPPGKSSASEATVCVEPQRTARMPPLGDYVDMPVRTYSAGMLMRLAFSISTSVEPDILLMDEWLSVGDSELTEKAEKRMRMWFPTPAFWSWPCIHRT